MNIHNNFESRVEVNASLFRGLSGADECHMVFRPVSSAPLEIQMDWISRAYLRTLESMGFGENTSVMKRFFCSDLVNQASLLEKTPLSCSSAGGEPCAVSWVCQPPGQMSKISMWAYHVLDSRGRLEKKLYGNTFVLKRGEMAHHWISGVNSSKEETSYRQTLSILDKYSSFLSGEKMSLSENVVRTWFYVKNIDANYKGFVDARREYFAACGLTPETHFIASTAVEGSHIETGAKVTMDAYAVSGLVPGQVRFLSAPENLSSTYVYGVTFERGTTVAYRDRKHVLISGTASIDSKGSILYPGDVLRQLDRTFENIESLLRHAGAKPGDMAVLIAYVRDISDYAAVEKRMKEKFPESPVITAYAPVCRPGWLVEVEGIAVIPGSDEKLPLF